MAASVRHHTSAVGLIGVLLAQADKGSRTVLRWMLVDDGRLRVLDEVGSGEELISYAGDPDLLLVDLALPGLNAHDAVQRFRPAHPGCTIVVLASWDAPYLRQAMTEAGADDYVVVTAPGAQLLDRLVQLHAARHTPLTSSSDTLEEVTADLT